MDENKGVLVYGEIVDGKLSSTTCELLGCGRRLAEQLGGRLACVLAGTGAEGVATDACSRGAGTAYVTEAAGGIEALMAIAVAAVEAAQPAVVLVPHAGFGRELGPRLAFRLGSAAATDCIDVKVDSETGRVVLTKPVYGGNALADFASDRTPLVATVRPKAMSAEEPSVGATCEKVELSIEAPATVATVIERVEEKVEGIKLEDAVTVVSGGRGTGGADPFNTILKDLADVLHGAVGASRPPCDNGWAPEAMHIGLTGKIVAPDLYIAVAISGASQHMAGCSGSKTLVAINKDEEANIFREATYGVVGRFEDVVPAFTEKLKELLAD